MVSKLAARTVHLKLQPAPRTFAQRREVLRVLERFGEVNMFRSLKFDPMFPVPNAFLCCFGSPDAAKKVLNASPIRYRLLDEKVTLEKESSARTTDPAYPAPVFELCASKSSFPHEEFVSMSPLYGPWTPVNGRASNIAADLQLRIPSSISALATRDWESDVAMSRGQGESSGRDDGPRLKGTAGQAGRQATMPLRVRRKLLQQARDLDGVPDVMKGLTDLGEAPQTA